jgi:hypothetical protein
VWGGGGGALGRKSVGPPHPPPHTPLPYCRLFMKYFRKGEEDDEW